MNIIQNLKERCTSLWILYQRKTFFVGDVSNNQTTGRRWQTTRLDTRKVPQIHWLRQKVADHTSWYTEGTSDTLTSSEGGRPHVLIHGRYLRYIDFFRRWQTTRLDTRKVPQKHWLCQLSVNQTTGRRWQTTRLDVWKVPQIHWLRQGSVQHLNGKYILCVAPCT